MARRKRLTPLPELSGPSPAPTSAPPAADIRAPEGREGRGTARAPIAAVAAGAAAEAALDEVAREMAAAREEGRLAQAIPLDAVEVAHLARDRLPPGAGSEADGEIDDEMEALVESLRLRGQQTPIEVVDLGQGRYGLISGWRRLTALRRLAEAGERAGGAVPGTVLAVLRAPATAAEAYVAMVEENEIRAGLSYWERARIVAQSVARGAFPDRTAALRGLFGTASRAKRSKIGSFLVLVEALEGAIGWPAALPERLGLQLAMRLKESPGAAAGIAAALAAARPSGPEEEQAALARALSAQAAPGAGTDSGSGTGARSGRRTAPTTPTEVRDADGLIYMAIDPESVTLYGPGVTSAFCDDLMRWLDDR